MAGLQETAKLARRDLRRARQRLRHGRLAAPVLFGNSFPKSGTHLLTQVLAGFSRFGPAVDSGLPAVLTYDGPSGQPRPIETILAELLRLRPGDVAYGHLHATPEVLAQLCSPGFASYFIYRDPRDVVVSHVFYVTDMAPKHVHHYYYKNELPDFESRLRTSILGRPELEVPFPDIRARFEPYLPGLARPEVLALRFEDFLSEQQASLERVFDHALVRGFPYDGPHEAALAQLTQAVAPEQSPTFRQGKSGAWRQHFTPEIKALFKDVTGDLLLQLGYEDSQDW